MGTAIVIVIAVFAGLVLLYVCYSQIEVTLRRKKMYEQAVAEMNKGNYGGAETGFQALSKFNYRDSAQLAETCRANHPKQIFNEGVALMKEGKIDLAIVCFSSGILVDNPEAQELLRQCRDMEREPVYQLGLQQMQKGAYQEAVQTFGKLWAYRTTESGAKEKIWGYKDSDEKQAECQRLLDEVRLERNYRRGIESLEKGELFDASINIKLLPDGYRDKADLVRRLYNAMYEKGVECFEKGSGNYSESKEWYPKALELFKDLPRDYRDTDDYMRRVCQTLYGSDFCEDSPYYQHNWEVLEHIVDVDGDLRKIGHGRRRCKCCGKTEDFSYDYDTDGY